MNPERQRKHLSIQSSIFNALLPKFLKHFVYNLALFSGLYLVYFVVEVVFELGKNLEVILSLIFISLVLSFFFIVKDLIVIKCTEFRFYAHHLETTFKLLHEENHSINYSQITNIEVKKTLWDRMCNVGDIIIHTSNDFDSNNNDHLTLKDIKFPDSLRAQIMRRIHV